MLNLGRYEGDIFHFQLWDPERTNRKAGFYFQAVAEWIDNDWLSQCEKCHSLRVLRIDIQKETWQCQCGRAGTFKKPEKKLEKKRDWPGSRKNE